MEEFKKDLPDEYIFLKDLEKKNFSKYLSKLAKKLAGKTVVFYGAGSYFNTINDYYNLNCLNILGISDIKFNDNSYGKFYGEYKVIPPDEIINLNPDYILITTRYCFNLGLSLIHKFSDTKIKVKPLVKKGFFELLKGG